MNESCGNALVVKEVNTALVSKALQNCRAATKQELSQLTGLSLMTVGTILQQLEESGEVLQGEQVPSAGGRPSRQYRYNADSTLRLAVQTLKKDGFDTAEICVANAFDEIVYLKEFRVSHMEAQSFFAPIDDVLNAYPAIRSIAVGLPGVVQGDTVVSCDFGRLAGCDLGTLFRERYGLPVVLDNDVNCVVAGRCRGRELQPETAVVALYFPRVCALGAGIWIGSGVYRGFRSYAGEVSDMPLGIDWCSDQTLYDDEMKLAAAIAKLVTSLCCVLDPQEIVLYGRVLTERHLNLILEHLKRTDKLSGDACSGTRARLPEIVLSPEFETDYRNGLLHQARSLLKPAFELRRN